MTPEERAKAEAEMSEHFGMKVVIDDNVPDGVWGFVGDFTTAFDPEPNIVRIDK